jgi:hypothetical protein
VKRFWNAGILALVGATSGLFAEVPVITASDPLPTAVLGEPYQYDVVIDPMPMKWGAVSLPPGFTYEPGASPTIYRLAGTPTQTGTFSIEFFAEDAEGNEARVTRQLGVTPPEDPTLPTIEITGTTVETLPGENVYRFLFTFFAADNLAIDHLEFRGAVAHGAFDAWKPYPYLPDEPMEIILHCTAFDFEVRAVDIAGNRSAAAAYSFVADDELIFTTQGGAGLKPAKGRVGKKFLYKVKAKGAVKFTATGLPPGCRIDPTTGTIKGVPKKAGTYTVRITATGPRGSAKTTLRIRVSK